MQNFSNCVNYRACTQNVIISCKLGLWEVIGPYTEETARQAEEKYKQFKALGKYKDLIRGYKNEAIKTK